MKRCPECLKTYPDAERFCSSDGATLLPVEGERATRQMDAESATSPEPAAVECPVCGGKALPGEEICSFCGARLIAVEGLPPSPAEAAPRRTVREMPPQSAMSQHTFDDEPPVSERRSAGRRLFAWTGYTIAALLALAAGAWFALHLSSIGSGSKPLSTREKGALVGAAPNPAESSAPANEPMVALATTSSIQVTGESSSNPARNTEAARKVFGDNAASLLDVYRHDLANDSSLHDGMLATVTVNPSGNVVAGAVKTSTSSNPALDSEVVNTMMGWHFPPFSGSSVEVSYPVIMARNSAEQASTDSALADKIAHLSPSETPEYASAPPAPSPAPAAETSPAVGAEKTPVPLAAVEPIRPPSEAPPVRRHRRRVSAGAVAPPPRPSLLDRVKETLRSDPRLRGTKAYTAGSVVTLYGTVFDDNDKARAERAVKGVDGVSDVVDNLQTATANWAAEENAINQQLQSAGLSKVTAKVIGKAAYLSGEVSTDAEKEHAVTVAESAAPVRVRTNLIRVVPKGVFSW